MKFFAIWLALLGIQFSAAEKLTVEQATQVGLENSLDVKTAKSQLRKAKQQTNQALGSLGPKLDAQGYYERYDAKREFGFGDGAIDAKRASLVLNYPLDLSGLRGKALKAAKSNEDSIEQGIDVASIETKEEIRRAYFNVLRAEWAVQVQTETLTAAKGRLENAKLLYNAGAAARFDVLRFETEVQRKRSPPYLK